MVPCPNCKGAKGYKCEDCEGMAMFCVGEVNSDGKEQEEDKKSNFEDKGMFQEAKARFKGRDATLEYVRMQ